MLRDSSPTLSLEVFWPFFFSCVCKNDRGVLSQDATQSKEEGHKRTRKRTKAIQYKLIQLRATEPLQTTPVIYFFILRPSLPPLPPQTTVKKQSEFSRRALSSSDHKTYLSCYTTQEKKYRSQICPKKGGTSTVAVFGNFMH